MRGAFEQAGVLTSLMKDFRRLTYTKIGDPLKFDFGYRMGDEIKLFHAVPLKAERGAGDHAGIAVSEDCAGIAQTAQAHPSLTAVVDDGIDLDRNEKCRLHSVRWRKKGYRWRLQRRCRPLRKVRGWN